MGKLAGPSTGGSDMTVSRDQRFTSDRRCPICAGFDQAERGKGVRCYGFRSKNGKTSHCTSSEHSGSLPFNAQSDTYAHRLDGRCPCGVPHVHDSGNPGPAARSPRQSEIEVAYDYRDEQGELLFQTLRMKPKRFLQRRPDGKGDWIWKLGNTRRVLYRLPELIAADPRELVYMVEGEKDAERLAAMGAIGTTNPQGAGKWQDQFSEYLASRHVVIIPDNDPPDATKESERLKGQRHAMTVARSVQRHAASVRVLELPGLPSKGDFSDWADAGGTKEQLETLATNTPLYGTDNPYMPAGYTNGHDAGGDPFNALQSWSQRESRHRNTSRQFIDEGLLKDGYFINAEGREYYFDESSHSVHEIESFSFRAHLNETYKVNKTEAFFNFLIEDIKVEVHTRARRAQVSTFSRYDPKNNLMFVDLGNGRMLRMDGREVSEVNNGTDGVLFVPTPISEPWTWLPNDKGEYLNEILIDSLNFSVGEGSPHSPQQQKTLLLVWLLSIAFETVQPTKPLALALGPAGSGKSSMFRRIGKMLYGPAFEMDGLRKEGESDFFVATTNNPFCGFDNADKYIPWLEDALATSATGMKITKRVLHTTNESISYIPKAFIALTARTPHFRRDDVSERMIPFRVEKLPEKVAEYKLLQTVLDYRDRLMSEYCRLLNQTVAVVDSEPWDAGLRIADFGSVAMRIGAGLGCSEKVAEILLALQTSQKMFATEENDLVNLIEFWASENTQAGPAGIDVPNNARKIYAAQLFQELKALAELHGYRWRINNPVALGKQLNLLVDAMSIIFDVDRGHDNTGRWWQFCRKYSHVVDDEDPFELQEVPKT